MPIIKAGDRFTIPTDVTYNDVLQIDGTLELDPAKNVTVTMNNQNIVVNGVLRSRPNPGVIHTIRFTNVNETNFVGGGELVLGTDVGLWVVGSGKLDLQGEEKTAWTNSVGAIIDKATVIPVKEANNWKKDDDLVISRTSKTATDDDLRKIVAFSGTTITLDKPSTAHPMVNNMWTAEVLNLTRNMRIEGTATGQSHVFILSTAMQNIKNVQFRYLGPRKNTGGDSAKELVKGRYALHIHHGEDFMKGMVISGNVARDCNNHCFVVHATTGVTLRDNIAYNVIEAPYWYDSGEPTHGLTYEHNVAGKVGYVPGSRTLEDPTTPSFGASGFKLSMGDGNKCLNNVCFGIEGALGIDGTGAYRWPNDDESTWIFKGNIAHNCSTSALDIWQNTAMNHTLEYFTAYYCGSGGRLGAYANVYHYKDCIFYEAPLLVKHGSLTSLRTRFEGLTIINGGPGYGDYAGINAGIIQVGSPVDTIGDGQPPVLYLNCNLINCDFVLAGGEKAHFADFVNTRFRALAVKGSEVARIQQDGKAYQQTSNGKKDIPLFAPTNWGDGDGVLVEYFSDTNFKNKVAELIQPQANFTEWKNLGGPHHLCPGSNYSIRVTGQWQPQFTDSYTFSYSMDSGGSVELYIEGVLIKTSFAAKAAQKYKFELRFKSTGSQIAGFSFNAHCAAMALWQKAGETVPQSQLYTPGTVTPPVNKPPIANAGADQTITLPTNSVTLNGSGSDSDGTIVSYRWDYIAGPIPKVEIANPFSQSTLVAGFAEGSYLFRLQVVDNQGAAASDEISITVKPKPTTNQPPTANPIVKIGATFTDLSIDSNASDDGTIVSYLWTLKSGPTVTILNPATPVMSLKAAPQGTYAINLKLVDNSGNESNQPISFKL